VRILTNAAERDLSTEWHALSPTRACTNTRRIRILYIIDQLCTVGGAERALIRLIGALPEDKFSPELLTFRWDSTIELFKRSPCPLHVLPLRRTYDWTALKAARQLRELLHNRRIDIVHTFHESSDLWGGMIAKLSGVPILISSRRDMGYLRSVKHEIAYRVFGNCFDKVLAVSERVRERCISAERLTPSRVTTVYNGICLAEIDSVCTNRTYRSGLGVPMEAQLVAAVGNIRRIKGFDVLIRAAQLVCMEYPKAAFLLVGESSDRQCQAELRDMVNNLDLSPNVRFLGSRTDIVPILKASDVFCLPSRSEGFSNSLIEAMACRLPCVATDVGGNGEAIMDGINGYLVPPESPQALAGAILQFLKEPDRAQSMGREARGTVENRFTFEGMIERLVAMYEELAQSAAKRIN